MRWSPGGVSSDIEDRRASGGFGGFGGMGGGGIRIGLGGLLFLALLSLIFKQDFLSLISGGGGSPQVQTTGEADRDAGEHREVQFVSFVLDDVQRTWDQLLPQAGGAYRHAKLVLFRDYTESGCGAAESATGPFYCPADEKVYVDLGFFDELKTKFGAPGEFAQAYVLGHEIGHHVQKLLGIDRQVRQAQARDRSEANQLSVRLELQADCLSGVWAHSTRQRQIIDEADVAAGLQAAASVGDDRLQRMARGHVSPESFTHGSSAQRVEWFKRGLEAGNLQACDTFR